MDRVFPLGLPGPTAFYVTLYVLTFALHQAFMQYVLAGSAYVAWATIAPGGGSTPRWRQLLAGKLRDWMPFMLSAAITAGVAPLLFVQVIYGHAFYTAQLLLAWRWMVVIPVLIAAFYGLYLIKGDATASWRSPARAIVAGAVAAGFVFVGFCWTANYLLAVDQDAWPEIYAADTVPLPVLPLVARMFVWLGGACGTMSLIAAWQLQAARASSNGREPNGREIDTELRRLAGFASVGLVTASMAAIVYLLQCSQAARELALGTFALPYAVAAGVGVILQIGAWGAIFRGSLHGGADGRDAPARWPLVLSSCGWLLALVGVSVLREAIRLASINLPEINVRLAEARQIGGFGLFLLFATVNAALIAGCIWLVRRGLRAPSVDETT